MKHVLDACRSGDRQRVADLLLSAEDAEVKRLVAGIGGPRAMARFLVQRQHILHEPSEEGASLASWLAEHLREAEPMHLMHVHDALAIAEDGGHEAIVWRLKAHLKFLQPPDPTRWSRKWNTPEQEAFLAACKAGDPDAVRDALDGDEALVHSVNKWGQDGATLVGAYGSDRGHEVVPMLVEAGLRKSAKPFLSACWWGAEPVVRVLIDCGFPTHEAIDDDALWTAAVATRLNGLSIEVFEPIAAMLVEAGADVSPVNRWGTTAWGIALEEARPVLEKLGAEPRAKGVAKYDASTGCSGVVASGEGEGELDLNEAAAVGDVERVRTLLDEVYRLEPVLQGHGSPERPLHVAAWHGRVKVIFMLISEYGYSPGAVNRAFIDGQHVGPKESWDRTPVEIAALRGHEKALDVLMNSVDWFQGRRARRK